MTRPVGSTPAYGKNCRFVNHKTAQFNIAVIAETPLMLLFRTLICSIALIFAALTQAASASEFAEPWKSGKRALILDGYEFNEFDLVTISKNERIAAFIHKGSDGLAERYRCDGDEAAYKLCKTKWRRYAVGKELYHTRRTLAKTLGLKWGAYHLARPGNPILQADHFIEYTSPTEDELIVLDIEDIDAEKWMSLADAEIFAKRIHERLGRWPMLYTNGITAQHIANNRFQYQILSRLPLWYARYKPDIKKHFPKGNWQSYGIWQFQAQINCNSRRCPYRVKGANHDIDVNVVDMSVAELRAAWPMDALLEMRPPENLPIPMARPALEDTPKVLLAQSSRPVSRDRLFNAYVRAALVRGANYQPSHVDKMNTAAIDGALINDLY